MIKHIVMWKFMDHAEERSKQENLDLVKERLLSLSAIIPELKSIEIGQDMGVGRDPFDMVLITTFDDAAALERYQQHPEHKKISAFVAKVRSERACVDFSISG